MPRPTHCFAATAVAVVLTVSLVSQAQGPDDARSARVLLQQGNEALVRHDFQMAADRFMQADAISPDPVAELGLARAQAGLGKLASAHATYQRVVSGGASSSAPAVRKAVDDANREIQGLAQRLAWITIELEAPGESKVSLDGTAVERSALGQMQPIDPGKHAVKVTGDGLQADETVVISAGEERVVKLTLRRAAEARTTPEPQAPEPEPQPAPPAPPPPDGTALRAGGVLALIFGGVGLVVGTATGLMAASHQEDLTVACPHGACAPDHHADLDQYRILGTVSTVGFVTAGVGIGLGAVLLATAPSPVRPPRGEQARRSFEMTPTVGIGAVGAVGRF